jgi:hypothetical protein
MRSARVLRNFKLTLKFAGEPLGLGMLRIGFWKWPLVLLCTALGVCGSYYRTGGLVRYYETSALLKTANPHRLTEDLTAFRSPEVRREIASALGWIKPQPTPTQLTTVLDKLNRVLLWERAGNDGITIRGTGKDASGIAWVINTAAKTTVVLSGKAASPSAWSVQTVAQPARTPVRTEGWKLMAGGGLLGLFLSLLLFSGKRLSETAAVPVEQPAFILPVAPLSEPPAEVLGVPPEPKPIAFEILHPAPTREPVPVSEHSLYDEWAACAAPFYSVLEASLPDQWAEHVDRLMAKTTHWMEGSLDLMLRHLAHRSSETELTSHVVHTVLLSLAWSLREGLPHEETRALVWSALIHDVGLKVLPLSALLRAHSQRSQESAAHVGSISGLDPDFAALLVAVLSRLGVRRGMRPALTPDEEKAGKIARMLTRLDRQEKILRRRALILAKRHSLEKAI